LCDPSLTRAVHKRLRDEYHMYRAVEIFTLLDTRYVVGITVRIAKENGPGAAQSIFRSRLPVSLVTLNENVTSQFC